MTPNKKKIYLAMMLLGGLALVVDRCFLPKSVTAPLPVIAADPPRAAQPSIETAPPPANEALAALELPFPRTIPPWSEQSPIRDIFAPYSDEDTGHKPRSRSTRDAEAGHGSSASFQTKHRLDAVLVQDRLKIAIVNGAWVRVGESLDGCALMEIAGNKVRFRCRDGEVVLSLRPGE